MDRVQATTGGEDASARLMGSGLWLPCSTHSSRGFRQGNRNVHLDVMRPASSAITVVRLSITEPYRRPRLPSGTNSRPRFSFLFPHHISIASIAYSLRITQASYSLLEYELGTAVDFVTVAIMLDQRIKFIDGPWLRQVRQRRSRSVRGCEPPPTREIFGDITIGLLS